MVVTVNYRLGAFGFLYGDTDTSPGNLGFYDQVLGLNWVKQNIEAFGGNPNLITIFGESAGGWSVSALITSPVSLGLFQRAIIESGTLYYPNNWVGNGDKNSQIEEAIKLSKGLGCDVEQWLQCLRKIDAQKITDYNGFRTNPSIGGQFLPKSTTNAINTGDFPKGIYIHIILKNYIN